MAQERYPLSDTPPYTWYEISALEHLSDEDVRITLLLKQYDRTADAFVYETVSCVTGKRVKPRTDNDERFQADCAYNFPNEGIHKRGRIIAWLYPGEKFSHTLPCICQNPFL